MYVCFTMLTYSRSLLLATLHNQTIFVVFLLLSLFLKRVPAKKQSFWSDIFFSFLTSFNMCVYCMHENIFHTYSQLKYLLAHGLRLLLQLFSLPQASCLSYLWLNCTFFCINLFIFIFFCNYNHSLFSLFNSILVVKSTLLKLFFKPRNLSINNNNFIFTHLITVSAEV